MKLAPNLDVLIVLDHARYEPNPHQRIDGEKQAPAADHAVTKEAWRSVEEHDIEPFARHDTPEARQQQTQFGSRVVGGRVGDEDGHIDVAVCPGAPACPRAEQVGELDLGERSERRGELLGDVVPATAGPCPNDYSTTSAFEAQPPRLIDSRRSV